jgi:hypothetical protein
MASTEKELIEKTLDFISNLNPSQLKNLFSGLFNLLESSINEIEEGFTAVKELKIPCGKVDLYYSSNNLGVSIEIKEEWKPSPGQLEQYYKYARENNENAFLIL